VAVSGCGAVPGEGVQVGVKVAALSVAAADWRISSSPRLRDRRPDVLVGLRQPARQLVVPERLQSSGRCAPAARCRSLALRVWRWPSPCRPSLHEVLVTVDHLVAEATYPRALGAGRAGVPRVGVVRQRRRAPNRRRNLSKARRSRCSTKRIRAR